MKFCVFRAVFRGVSLAVAVGLLANDRLQVTGYRCHCATFCVFLNFLLLQFTNVESQIGQFQKDSLGKS